MRTEVYPVIIKMKTKDVQIGTAKVEFGSGKIINRIQQEHDVVLKEIKLNYIEEDWIAKALSRW